MRVKNLSAALNIFQAYQPDAEFVGHCCQQEHFYVYYPKSVSIRDAELLYAMGWRFSPEVGWNVDMFYDAGT